MAQTFRVIFKALHALQFVWLLFTIHLTLEAQNFTAAYFKNFSTVKPLVSYPRKIFTGEYNYDVKHSDQKIILLQIKFGDDPLSLFY